MVAHAPFRRNGKSPRGKKQKGRDQNLSVQRNAKRARKMTAVASDAAARRLCHKPPFSRNFVRFVAKTTSPFDNPSTDIRHQTFQLFNLSTFQPFNRFAF